MDATRLGCDNPVRNWRMQGVFRPVRVCVSVSVCLVCVYVCVCVCVDG